MADSIMYQEDYFVVLEANKAEEFLTVDQLRQKLTDVLLSRLDNLPIDLEKYPQVADQVEYLINYRCELDLEQGYLQWYAVRLEK